MPIHLIFEGAELSGKSFLMSKVYSKLEFAGASSPNVLDGCVWINSDVGVLGTVHGQIFVEKFVDLAEVLKEKNVIFEKLHISDQVYQKLYNQTEVDYSDIEARLKILNYKIVLITFEEDEDLIKTRLQDRINLYPHYARIAKGPSFYIDLQRKYRDAVQASGLPFLEIDLSNIDDRSDAILDWVEAT